MLDVKILVWDDYDLSWFVPIVRKIREICPEWVFDALCKDDDSRAGSHKLASSFADIYEECTRDKLTETERSVRVVFELYHARTILNADFNQYPVLVSDLKLDPFTYGGSYDDKQSGIHEAISNYNDCILDEFGALVLGAKYNEECPDGTIIIVSDHVASENKRNSLMTLEGQHTTAVINKGLIPHYTTDSCPDAHNVSTVEYVAQLVIGSILRWKNIKELEKAKLNLESMKKQKATIQKNLAREKAINKTLKNQIALGKGEQIIGDSEAMHNVYREIYLNAICPTEPNIFIHGESGTGKELVAKQLRRLSIRKDKPFFAINIAAMPTHLIESELFGHEKGSFTGAHKQRIGRFEKATDGILFLDEIGDMPMNLQVKLLRALQEGVINRVGGNEEIKVDVQVISATSCNLNEKVAEGLFRIDLFYRIKADSPILIPPLRERGNDLMELVEFYSNKYSEIFGLKIEISNQTKRALLNYSWPGNVRELENTIEALYKRSQTGSSSFEDLPPAIRESSNALPSTLNCDDNIDYWTCPITDTSFPKETVLKAYGLLSKILQGEKDKIMPCWIYWQPQSKKYSVTEKKVTSYGFPKPSGSKENKRGTDLENWKDLDRTSALFGLAFCYLWWGKVCNYQEKLADHGFIKGEKKKLRLLCHAKIFSGKPNDNAMKKKTDKILEKLGNNACIPEETLIENGRSLINWISP
ncbi:MAG: sigma-54 dependent transcriptional regulator [Kiritimatiellae bacterium]|jgi:transcriptional regulator with GAF, ATPase, and Fis domain|nr:sigma-54 dependent transcriptional regulator [Kiritimatiellia bacterium]